MGTQAVPAGSSRTATPSPSLRAYVLVLVAAGLAILVPSIVSTVQTPQPLWWLLFAAMAILTGPFKVSFASIEARISVADTFYIAMAILFGPGPATLALAADCVIIGRRCKDPWYRLAFNAVAPAFSLWVGAHVFFLAAGVPPLEHGHTAIGTLILPVFALTAIYFLLNSGLTAVAVGLEAGQPPFQIWRRHFQWLWVGYFGAASVSFCLILLIQQVSFAAVVVVLPLLAVFHLTLRASFGRLDDATRHLSDMNRLYLSTVETLAMAIDAKDDVTHSHVRRVQAYALALAHALEVTDETELKAIEAAALLHDTGKLAVPEHILNKPGGLTAAEFEKMKLHVDIGADILSLVEFPFPVVPIVRCHHESWDGSGYPRGISGTEIPIGARILSVVDCFDALTSDRPYRRAMSTDAALDILRERSGRMYDPNVVDTFLRIHRDVALTGADAPEHRQVLERITRTRQPPAPEASPLAAPAGAASDDVLAFVSLARLVSGEITRADVLALASTMILRLVPGATGAWYVPDPTADRLVAVETFGPSAALLRGASIGMGERLTGWVGASRQMIVNSPAALDLIERAAGAHPPLASCVSVPLTVGESLVAVLTLYRAEPGSFDDQCGRLLQMVAPQVAKAIHATAPSPSAKGAATEADKPARARELRLASAS
jgi:putative nucleotidyltransferase with HDIG domain